ncbi:hypothetical protein ACHMZP_07690 [Rhodococcus baikonurensis]|uniref:hypothetical protein n=1 Tax=Rhodococcus baikonurensis TaxID=172041 RepID=UPI0037BC4BCB
MAGSAAATHTGRMVINATSAMADLVLMVVNDFIESNSRCGIAFRISRADVSHGQTYLTDRQHGGQARVRALTTVGSGCEPVSGRNQPDNAVRLVS